MNTPHYRLPADLVRLIEVRLRSDSKDGETGLSNPLAALSNDQIAGMLREFMSDREHQTPVLDKHALPLTAEEQAQKDLLLNQIRTQAAKLTLRSSGSQLTLLDKTG